MLQIQRWTQGRVEATLKPEYLKLSDREWIDVIKPPYVFITGHKKFSFTEAEVENLREYLMLGGCLWVDNALPGRRSRFDKSLREQMKRVLPDRDFEPLPNDHPVYSSYFVFRGGPPKSVNFYAEAPEVVKIGGDVAVFYTLNAYSDLWETALTEKNELDTRYLWEPEAQQWVSYPGPHWDYNYRHGNSYKFFRNLNKESVNASYQFGINIVVYLLTRFQDKFMTLPRSAGS
jgi:hypothetical protein